MNTDDKASVLIQTVTIIAVTGVATLSCTDLISVLLNAVTDHAFFRVYLTCQCDENLPSRYSSVYCESLR